MPLPEPPPGLQAKCDQILSDLQTALATIQPAYRDTVVGPTGRTRERYWQGIWTHASPPADGTNIAPDKSRKPTDQAEDWNAVSVTLPSTMPLRVAVDVYAGPAGPGYVLMGELAIGNQVWRRAINVGPENRRSHDWQQVRPF